MLITIGEKTKKYMELLGIKEYPFTEDILKSNFREACKKNHPDMGGSDKQFIDVKNAYENLVNLAIRSDESSPQNVKKNTSVLEIFKTGVWEDCPICHGHKITKVNRDVVIDCPVCKGVGDIQTKCKPCKGTGRFITLHGFNVKCKACDGTKIYSKLVPCPNCNSGHHIKFRNIFNGYTDYYFGGTYGVGKGKILTKEPTTIPCTYCRSLGKIKLELFNSVIPEGAILR